MFIFLTVTLFFQFKYRLFTSRKMRVILNERALEPAFLAAELCALVFQPCRLCVILVPRALVFRAEKRKKHARTLHERGAPKYLKNGGNLINFFSIINNATAGIPVSSNNFPTQ